MPSLLIALFSYEKSVLLCLAVKVFKILTAGPSKNEKRELRSICFLVYVESIRALHPLNSKRGRGLLLPVKFFYCLLMLSLSLNSQLLKFHLPRQLIYLYHTILPIFTKIVLNYAFWSKLTFLFLFL
jgi:hypothetical protein